MNRLGEQVAVWAHRYQLKRGERWQKRHDMTKNSLPRWRTPKRRKALIFTFYAATICYLIVSIIQIFWFPAALSIPFLILPAIGSLTVLRITINCKDSAPIDFLDEYEYSVITTWKSIAYWLLCFHMLVFSYAFGFIAVFQLESQAQWIFSILMLNCSVFVLISSLPTIAYALTFSENPDESKEY